ncbi:MAG: hypothetical protein VKO21_04825 [Candidatus Sericytochromatia bacterium]|nr:hypothetical protein [Candidatus Sericytochromatia bacterium]
MLKSATGRLPSGQAPSRVAQGRTSEALSAERIRVRVVFSQPIFGGNHDWVFTCDGHQAEDLAQAVLQRKPLRLVFPTNTVILDGAQVTLVDFISTPETTNA